VGKIDNAQEAVILASDGYIVDEEFKDLAVIIMKIIELLSGFRKTDFKRMSLSENTLYLTVNKATGL
jgi:hypothetical protein